jgi:hypothetical protein
MLCRGKARSVSRRNFRQGVERCSSPMSLGTNGRLALRLTSACGPKADVSGLRPVRAVAFGVRTKLALGWLHILMEPATVEVAANEKASCRSDRCRRRGRLSRIYETRGAGDG